MAVQVASLFGVLSLDDSGFKDGLKNADSGLKTTSDKMKTFGKDVRNTGLVIMGAATPILAFAATAVQAAGESQQAIAQLDAVIKSTGGSAGVTSEHAQALASSLQQVTMYGDETVISAENMLLTFTNIGSKGGVFDLATQTALDMSTALGGDVTSSAMQLGKALNDPINGITALTRVGVTFTDSQKAQIEAMVKAGDVAGAQKVILQELQKEFGGSAVAAGQTFPGQLAILNNKFGEVQEKIGAALIPALMNIVTNIGPVIDKVASWIEKNPELVTNIVTIAGGAFALGGILTILGTAIGVVTTAVGILLSPAVLLIGAIAGIIYAADKLYPGGISKLLLDASTAAKQLATVGLYLLNQAAGWAQDRLTELQNTLKTTIDKIKEFLNIKTEIGGSVSTDMKDYFAGKKAGGGSVAGGSTYLVGEQGPELFTPSTSGNISTASDTASMLGGFSIYGGVHIHANSEAEGAAGMRGALAAARAKGY